MPATFCPPSAALRRSSHSGALAAQAVRCRPDVRSGQAAPEWSVQTARLEQAARALLAVPFPASP
ncbi:hypothetical protein LLE87_28475, partial [Paenibacillus polymyxa]|nr:hypothetical protein [Paenibacillus polymyxa]